MTEEQQRLESVLKELKDFLPSRVHREYVAATSADIEAVEVRILEDEITSLPDFLSLLDLRAQRRVLKSNLTSFEDTVTNLESRIAQLKRDEETKNVAQQNTEDNENDDQTTDDV